MQKVTIVARTIERDGDDFSAANNSLAFLGSYLRKDSMVFSGKAAGICYMPDDYLSNGIQNDETALKRALGNAKSGHYSVFEHSHISFLIETTKAMAMVLNSTKLYTTSEKSARYTKMRNGTRNSLILSKIHMERNILIRKLRNWLWKMQDISSLYLLLQL